MHEDLDRAWEDSLHRVLVRGRLGLDQRRQTATRTLGGRFRLVPEPCARVLTACAALGFDILPAVLWRKQTNSPNKFMGSGMLPAAHTSRWSTSTSS